MGWGGGGEKKDGRWTIVRCERKIRARVMFNRMINNFAQLR